MELLLSFSFAFFPPLWLEERAFTYGRAGLASSSASAAEELPIVISLFIVGDWLCKSVCGKLFVFLIFFYLHLLSVINKDLLTLAFPLN